MLGQGVVERLPAGSAWSMEGSYRICLRSSWQADKTARFPRCLHRNRHDKNAVASSAHRTLAEKALAAENCRMLVLVMWG